MIVKLLIVGLLLVGMAASAQNLVLATDVQRLTKLKELAMTKNTEAVRLVTGIKKDADAALKLKPLSVMDKQRTPDSGTKHDYMSQAPYFWYDSSKPNGLPYMRKDGVRNPEINLITDRTNIGKLETATRALSLAWYLTSDEQYAAKAAILLRHWFIVDSTKMNPNLEYAQAIPGVNAGRGIGLIESRMLINIGDAAGLLSGSKAWTAIDAKNLTDWYATYLKWMLESKNGKEEHAAKNNHGTWYYAQVVHFALFTGDKALAVSLIGESKKLLDNQLTADGKQPLELERTNALGYSTLNLEAWFTVARLSSTAGVDLWSYKTAKGAGLRAAIDWVIPFALGKEKFTYQQIGKYNPDEIYPLLLQAGKVWKDEKYLEFAKETGKGNEMDEVLYVK